MASLTAELAAGLDAVEGDTARERQMFAAVAVAVRCTLVGKKSKYERTCATEPRD